MTDTISQLPQHNDAAYAQHFMSHPELHQQIGLERSYGFLLAASSAPSLVMPDEWLEAIWLEKPEQGMSQKTRYALVGLYNHWQQQKNGGVLELPTWQGNSASLAAFCSGYLAAQDWLHNLWQESLQRFGDQQDERILSGTLLLCLRLSADEVTLAALGDKISEQDAQHLLPSKLLATSQLAQRMFDAHQQGQQATNPQRDIGRNSPCPCGSGKKFKKCCGK